MKTTFYLIIITLVTSFGFTLNTGVDYQLVPVQKIHVEKHCHPTVKTGVFIYAEPKALHAICADSMQKFDFATHRIIHVQYKEQPGCSDRIEAIQEVRKYKHYYEVILVDHDKGICKTMVKPYQTVVIPNDGHPVMFSGALPE